MKRILLAAVVMLIASIALLLLVSGVALAQVVVQPISSRGVNGIIDIVTDKGARCDGVTSDYAAIQSAVTDAVAQKKAVYIPPSAGGCVIPTNVSSTVSITGPVTFFGAGPASTVYLKGSSWINGGGAYFMVQTTTSTSNIVFEDMRFLGDYDMNTAGPAVGAAAILMGNNVDLKIVTNNTRVSRVTFEKLGGPAVQWGGGDWQLANCCQGTGHLVESSNFINSGSLNDQLNAFSDGVRNVVITSNVFRDTRATAIEMAGYEHAVLGNTLTRVHGAGVMTTGRDVAGEGIVVSHNTFADVGVSLVSGVQSCIQISEGTGSQRPRIINNQLHNCGQHGIWIASGVTDVVVADNYVDCPGYTSTGAGVYVGSGAVRGKVINNFVRACVSGGTSNYGVLISGGNTDFWADNNVTMGSFSGSSYIYGASLGAAAVGGGTRDFIGVNNFDLTSKQRAVPTDSVNVNMVPLFADGTSTPSIAGWPTWRTTNTGSTTITNFLDGQLGQTLTILFRDNNTTIQNNSNIVTAGRRDRKYTTSDVAQYIKDYSNWREVPSVIDVASSTPASPADGMIWTETSAGKTYMKARVNGTTFFVGMSTSTAPY